MGKELKTERNIWGIKCVGPDQMETFEKYLKILDTSNIGHVT